MGYDGQMKMAKYDQIKINLVQNRKENCHDDHIPGFNLKGNGSTVFSVCRFTRIYEYESLLNIHNTF